MSGKILWFVFMLMATTAFSVQSQDRIFKRQLILGVVPDPLIYIGAERIREKSKTPVDLFHSSSYSSLSLMGRPLFWKPIAIFPKTCKV